MISKIKKPVSILLSLIMVFSLFTIVPLSASAAVGDIVPESEYLTFTAEEAGSSVTLKYTGGTLQYNKNNSGWQSYTAGTRIDLASAGDSVRFRGKDTTFNYSNHVSIGGKVACSGNVMSLRLDDNGKVQGLSYICFSNMFYGCAGLITAPKLPETTLVEGCYASMFSGCTNLTVAPELPATALAPSCYSSMFVGCTSLTTAPELPATTLAPSCYERMFYGCTSLTTAPELPATTLASYCYSYMFAGCEKLTTAPELPATELEYACYSSMFVGCSKIKLSETQTAEYSIPYSVPSGGDGTTASYALDKMFRGTGGTFTGTPVINKTYYRPPQKYTVTWKNSDTTLETDTDVAEGTTPTYDGEAPEKASDKYYDYTFSGWSDDSNTYAADALPAVSGDVTYTAQFTATAKTFKVYVKKLTGGTYTIENLTGGTTVAQLKEIIADQIDIPVTAQQKLIFAGKQIEDAKTLAEYNIEKESTIHLVIRSYTVTWLNYDNSELGTTTVQYGATPSYDGTPERPEDANNTYTFAGWKNGETTYAPNELPAVTGDVTYTAQFDATAKPKDLFTGHTVTLGGDIGVNFYLNPEVINTYTGSKTVKFSWDGNETTVDVPATATADGYKVTCNVVAAQMAHKIKAEVYVGDDKIGEEYYSVQDYAETVFKNPAAYDDKGKPEQLAALAQALLNYGAMAQTVFYNSLKEHPDLANTTVGNNGYEAVTADQIGAAIKGESANLNAVAAQLGAKYYTSSLIYLSKNTLRVYFTPTTYPGTIPNADKYAGSQSDYYYYVDHANIPAAELDEQKELTVGDYTFTYTALDYAKAVVESTKMEPEQQNLAKSLYLYNMTANDYFDGGSEPEPAELFTKVTDVNQITSENIGESTFAEAKAWVLANWDDIRDNDNIVDVVYFVGTMTILKSISLYPDMSKQDFEEQAYEENPSINDLQFWFTYYGDHIYLCSN